jgi:hypothetical protein
MIPHSHAYFFPPFFAFFAFLGSLLILIPYWFIFKKAGFSPLLTLLMVVPLVNLFMLYYLAFAQWNVVPAASVYPVPPAGGYPPEVGGGSL